MCAILYFYKKSSVLIPRHMMQQQNVFLKRKKKPVNWHLSKKHFPLLLSIDCVC